MKKWSYIYRLRDPRTRRVRYIGTTTRPKGRASNHKSGLYHCRTMSKWWSELHKVGKSPVFEIVEVVLTNQRHLAEKEWIDFHVARGDKLVNDFGVLHPYPESHLRRDLRALGASND